MRPRLRLARLVPLAFLAVTIGPASLQAQKKLQVVATLPAYGSIAQAIGGDLATVTSIARGDEDPHFVNARPSYAAAISRADMFITTGLDLELWVPGLLDRANNARVVEGGPGFVSAYPGITLLDVPSSISRSAGDEHVYGNPHIYTDPINGILIARNILAGFKRLDPSHGAQYDANEQTFEQKIIERLFGAQLTQMLGKDVLFELARKNTFWDFARNQSYDGKPLTEYVGGWLAEGAPFRGQDIVCYHKNWAYFANRFQLKCALYIEPKPGIPPTPGHVADVIEQMKAQHIRVLLAANYFSRSEVERVAERTDAVAVMVPINVGGATGVNDYFDLIEYWVSHLAAAFQQTAQAGGQTGQGGEQ